MSILQQMLLGAYPPPSGGGIHPNLVAWYKAENNANDEVGTNHGTAGAGTAYVAGVDGQAFSMNGNHNSKVLIPAAALSLSLPYTIELYIRVSGASALFGNTWNNSAVTGVARITSSAAAPDYNAPAFVYNSATRNESHSCLILGHTYKLTYIFTTGGLTLYLNNFLYPQNYAESFSMPLTNFSVGGDITNVHNTINGIVDEVKIYNDAVVPSLPVSGIVVDYAGDSTTDLSGNNFQIANGSSPLYADGPTGTPNTAFLFSGSANNRRAVNVWHYNGQTQFTIQFDMYATSGSNGLIFGNDNYLHPGIVYQSASQRMLIRWNGGNPIVGTDNSVPLNTWKNIKLTYNSGTLNLYVDSVLNGTAAGLSLGRNAADFLGQNAFFGTWYLGRVANFKYYNAVV